MEYLSIPHYRGLKEKYDEQKHSDGIFFTTDTHEIIANNATYGETIDTWSIADGILTLTMTSGKTLEITFDEATESAKGFLSAEDKKKINVTLNIDLSNTDISVIECIVGDKEVDDDDYFQVHSVYKQNLAILSNDIDYNYYPPIYLYDSQLVQVQFFDILFILIHFNSPLFDTSSFTL